jgi:hypothetical protein
MMRATGTALVVVAVVGFIVGIGPSEFQAADDWQWSITPYLWATDINETLHAGDLPLGGSDRTTQ